jgi:hypothetical protein
MYHPRITLIIQFCLTGVKTIPRQKPFSAEQRRREEPIRVAL